MYINEHPCCLMIVSLVGIYLGFSYGIYVIEASNIWGCILVYGTMMYMVIG